MKFLKNKIVKILITIIFLLLLVLPYSTSFDPARWNDSAEGWHDNFILKNIELMIIYLPFICFWSAYLFLQENLMKIILKYIILCLSFLYCIISLLSFFPSQDLIPNIGVYISVLLFPLVLLMTGMDYFKKRSNAS